MLHKVPILLHGVIENNTGLSFQAIVKVFPIERHYEEPNQPPYIKYTCPVCDKITLFCTVNLTKKIAENRQKLRFIEVRSAMVTIYEQNENNRRPA